MVKIKIGELNQHYRYISNIGNGSYGSVDLYSRKGQKFAIKKCKININNISSILNEINILSRNIPGVVPCFEIYLSQEYVYYVLKYYKTNLDNFSKLEIFKNYDFQKIINSLSDIIIAFHENGFIHKDLKAENILVNYDNNSANIEFALADFSLSELVYDSFKSKSILSDYLQTYSVKSPECILKHVLVGNEHKIDYWSLGCLLYKIQTGKEFLYDSDDLSILIFGFEKLEKTFSSYITKEKLEKYKTSISYKKDVPSELKSLLRLDPTKRKLPNNKVLSFNFNEIINDPIPFQDNFASENSRNNIGKIIDFYSKNIDYINSEMYINIVMLYYYCNTEVDYIYISYLVTLIMKPENISKIDEFSNFFSKKNKGKTLEIIFEIIKVRKGNIRFSSIRNLRILSWVDFFKISFDGIIVTSSCEEIKNYVKTEDFFKYLKYISDPWILEQINGTSS